MSTPNICFYGEKKKIIPKLSSNTLLICSFEWVTPLPSKWVSLAMKILHSCSAVPGITVFHYLCSVADSSVWLKYCEKTKTSPRHHQNNQPHTNYGYFNLKKHSLHLDIFHSNLGCHLYLSVSFVVICISVIQLIDYRNDPKFWGRQVCAKSEDPY